MKKPKLKDFFCDSCGMVHEWEYKEAVKKYKEHKDKCLKVKSKK